jgi:hypothetical protein
METEGSLPCSQESATSLSFVTVDPKYIIMCYALHDIYIKIAGFQKATNITTVHRY